VHIVLRKAVEDVERAREGRLPGAGAGAGVAQSLSQDAVSLAEDSLMASAPSLASVELSPEKAEVARLRAEIAERDLMLLELQCEAQEQSRALQSLVAEAAVEAAVEAAAEAAHAPPAPAGTYSPKATAAPRQRIVARARSGVVGPAPRSGAGPAVVWVTPPATPLQVDRRHAR